MHVLCPNMGNVAAELLISPWSNCVGENCRTIRLTALFSLFLLLMQSSKGSLHRYYSVASAFKCDHFKSIDGRLGSLNDESSGEHSNSSCTPAALFCHSSCFCSTSSRAAIGTIGTMTSHAANGTIGTMTSKSTSTEIPTSSYSQLDTSDSTDSSSESIASSDTTEDSDANYDTAKAAEESKNENTSSDSRVNLDAVIFLDAFSECRIEPVTGESRVASDTTIAMEESIEEFFTDAAIDNICHCKDAVRCGSVDSPVPLLRKSSSTSKLMAGTQKRYIIMVCAEELGG